jgi:hypothetical protein
MGFILEIALIVLGISALVRGQIQISKKRKLTGWPVRILGLVYLLPAGIVLVLTMLFGRSISQNVLGALYMALIGVCVLTTLGIIIFAKGEPT